jgi:hypothetical protein
VNWAFLALWVLGAFEYFEYLLGDYEDGKHSLSWVLAGALTWPIWSVCAIGKLAWCSVKRKGAK